jgi:hypothetical protein
MRHALLFGSGVQIDWPYGVTRQLPERIKRSMLQKHCHSVKENHNVKHPRRPDSVKQNALSEIGLQIFSDCGLSIKLPYNVAAARPSRAYSRSSVGVEPTTNS